MQPWERFATEQPTAAKQPWEQFALETEVMAADKTEKPMIPAAARIQGFNQTVPFGNRITAGAASLALAPFTDLTTSELYETARAKQKATSEAYPDYETTGNLLGVAATLPISFSKAVATTPGLGNAANALTKATTATGNFIGRGATALGKAGRSAVVAAPVGAIYGYGAGEEGSRVEAGLSSAGVAGALGGALPLAGATLGAALNKTPKPLNADKIRELGSVAYKQADELGGSLTPQFTNKFVDSVDAMRPQTEAGKILSGDDAYSKIADRVKLLRDRKLSLQEAQEIDEFLGDTIDQFTEMGRVTKQGKKLLDVQTSLRNMIDDADEGLIEGGRQGFDALKQGRQLWAAQAKMRDIEKIITRAENMQQPATAIKNGFNTLLNNPQRMRGYSAQERKLIKEAATTGLIPDLLRTGGSRLIPIIAGASGGGVLGTAAAGGASMASRGLATKNAMLKAERVAGAISERAVPGSTATITWQEAIKMQPAKARKALENLYNKGAQ